MSENNNEKLNLLYSAIEDNQNTIRFTDTKAGAVFVLCGVIFAFIGTLLKEIINFHKTLLNAFPSNNYDIFLQIILITIFLLGMGFLYLSIRLSLKAISPKSGPIGSIKIDTKNRVPSIFYLFKISPTPNLTNVFNDKNGSFKLEHSFSEIKTDIASIENSDILDILIIELQKVSFIRELKIQRVRQAVNFLIIGIDFLLVQALIIFLITLYK